MISSKDMVQCLEEHISRGLRNRNVEKILRLLIENIEHIKFVGKDEFYYDNMLLVPGICSDTETDIFLAFRYYSTPYPDDYCHKCEDYFFCEFAEYEHYIYRKICESNSSATAESVNDIDDVFNALSGLFKLFTVRKISGFYNRKINVNLAVTSDYFTNVIHKPVEGRDCDNYNDDGFHQFFFSEPPVIRIVQTGGDKEVKGKETSAASVHIQAINPFKMVSEIKENIDKALDKRDFERLKILQEQLKYWESEKSAYKK